MSQELGSTTSVSIDGGWSKIGLSTARENWPRGGTPSPLFKRLEALELIERRRDSSDGRQVTLRLTNRGRSHESEAPRPQHGLREALPMSDQELAALHALVQRFSAATRTPPPATHP